MEAEWDFPINSLTINDSVGLIIIQYDSQKQKFRVNTYLGRLEFGNYEQIGDLRTLIQDLYKFIEAFLNKFMTYDDRVEITFDNTNRLVVSNEPKKITEFIQHVLSES